jgi:hypothetical protein
VGGWGCALMDFLILNGILYKNKNNKVCGETEWVIQGIF